MYGDLSISEAFSRADNVLATAAKGIAEIITVPGYINVDFADVETVMRKSGMALMGTGISSGENRAEEAVEIALNSPLLNNNDIRGAKNVLLNITSGNLEVTMDEVGLITDIVQNKAGFDADLIWGNGKDDSLGDNLSVTIIATGFSTSNIPELNKQTQQVKEKHTLVENEIVKSTFIPNKPPKKESVSTEQKFIEFIANGEKIKEADDFESLYPGTAKERHGIHKNPTETDYTDMSEEDVDNLESIPAYERRKLRMNDPQYKAQRSHYSVTSENKISDKNKYLHEQVD
jgi:cell division protein FtsZ